MALVISLEDNEAEDRPLKAEAHKINGQWSLHLVRGDKDLYVTLSQADWEKVCRAIQPLQRDVFSWCRWRRQKLTEAGAKVTT